MKNTINLLILEDNMDDFFLLEETLGASERIHAAMIHFTRLRDALEHTDEQKIEAAILDLAVPDSFGMETYLSFSSQFPHIPVIVMTGYKDNELAIEAVQNGAQDYIFKGDASIDTLERTLLYAIERHRLITALKRSTETIQKLDIAVEQSPVSILITDIEGNIEYVNKRFCQLTGYCKSEVIGENPRLLKSGKMGPDTYEELWETISSNRQWRGEIWNRKKTGELYWEDASISPVQGDDGRIINYIAIKEDITDRKAYEQLRDDVDKIMRHDLKGPLTAIIAMPEMMMLKGGLNREQEKLAKLVMDAGHTMLNMIDLSLDIIKMENNEFCYFPEQIDLTAVLFKLVGETCAKRSQKNLDCRLFMDGSELTENMALKIWSEPQLVYRLLSNLMMNAIEASPEDETIRVDLHSSGDHTLMTIKNKGAVPEQIRSDFFGKYKTYGKRKGTGLGTYSAKLMADAMNYAMRMETSDSEGFTCLHIGIPKDPPARDFNWLI